MISCKFIYSSVFVDGQHIAWMSSCGDGGHGGSAVGRIVWAIAWGRQRWVRSRFVWLFVYFVLVKLSDSFVDFNEPIGQNRLNVVVCSQDLPLRSSIRNQMMNQIWWFWSDFDLVFWDMRTFIEFGKLRDLNEKDESYRIDKFSGRKIGPFLKLCFDHQKAISAKLSSFLHWMTSLNHKRFCLDSKMRRRKQPTNPIQAKASLQLVFNSIGHASVVWLVVALRCNPRIAFALPLHWTKLNSPKSNLNRINTPAADVSQEVHRW